MAANDDSVLSELAGRMYESCDIQRAIEAGCFNTLDDLAEHLKTQSGRLDRTIRAALGGEALEVKDCCVVLKD